MAFFGDCCCTAVQQFFACFPQYSGIMNQRTCIHYPSPPLDSIWVMVIVWRLGVDIIRTALCWIVWHNVHSQQHTYMSSSYRSNRLGLSHRDRYTMCRGSCIIVTWWSGSGGIQAWSRRLSGLIVPEMTYNVLSGTLSNQSTNQRNVLLCCQLA